MAFPLSKEFMSFYWNLVSDESMYNHLKLTDKKLLKELSL